MKHVASSLVQVNRGPYVESTHQISACVATADDKVLCAVGDIDQAYPVRSLAKPFLAGEFVRSGAADAYYSDDTELALAAGSHDGEQRHVSAIRAFLAKLEVGEDSLLCGPAIVGRLNVGPPVANNCSGKHSAVLAMCRHLSLGIENYIAPDHPIEQQLMSVLFDQFGRTNGDTPLAVDGCGMPIFGASLRQIATAYARFGSTNEPSLMRVRAAMTAQPEYVGGWFSNLDTCIIAWSDGAIIGKIGAEGLHADAIVGEGIGISVKVHDGNSRALSPVLAQLFAEFTPCPSIKKEHLAELAMPAVLNASGRNVGAIQAVDNPLSMTMVNSIIGRSTSPTT